ncbi:MAG: hypothetical protein ACRC4N_14210 [Gammaproteobacteria bacterium]
MKKIVMFTNDYYISDIISGIPESYEYDLTYVKSDSIYHLNGASSPFIVVDDFRIITEITKEEVIKFLLDAVLERLKLECEKELQREMYSPTTGKKYFYGLYDQLKMAQQLAILVAKENPNLNPNYSPYSPDELIIWKTIDAGFIPHTKQEFFQVCEDAEKHTRNWMGKMWQVEVALSQQIKEYYQLSEIGSFMSEFNKLLEKTTQGE